MKKRILPALLALLMLLSLLPAAAAAAAAPRLFSEFFPAGTIDAPSAPYLKLTVDDIGTWGDTVELFAMVPPEIRAVATAGEKWDDEHSDGTEMLFNRFDVYSLNFVLQSDARIDGGAWQYTADWDSPDFFAIEGLNDYAFTATNDFYGNAALERVGISDVSFVYTGEGVGFLADILTPFTNEDGEVNYHYDLDNHTLGVRCRIMMRYVDEEGGEVKTIISDWSPETSIGKNGNQKPLEEPTWIEAPTLSQFSLEVTEEDGLQFPYVKFFISIPDNVYEGLMYCLAEEDMFEPFRIEPQIRLDGGWVDFTIGNPEWIFDGLRGGGPSAEYPFTADSEVKIRARFRCDDLDLASEWSNEIGTKPTFTAHAWAQAELEAAYDLNLIPASLRGADLTQPVTRAEFAAISLQTYRAITHDAVEIPAENPFTDTQDEDVLRAYGLGITDGTGSGKFEPDKNLNRQEAATMLTRVYKKTALAGWTLKTDGSFAAQFKTLFTAPAPFPDDADIAAWAKDSVYFMAANGIINGFEDGTFRPQSIASKGQAEDYARATREQALLIAVRMVKNLG